MIKVKYLTACSNFAPKNIGKGDLADLCLEEDAVLKKGEMKVFSLGVAMQLPEGFMAKVYPRSSTPGKWGVMVSNSVGIIDNSYHGQSDIWRVPLYAMKSVTIPAGTRIIQFEVCLSPKAGILAKLKWLFSKGVKFVETTSLSGSPRGGFGSTGTK